MNDYVVDHTFICENNCRISPSHIFESEKEKGKVVFFELIQKHIMNHGSVVFLMTVNAIDTSTINLTKS